MKEVKRKTIKGGCKTRNFSENNKESHPVLAAGCKSEFFLEMSQVR